MPNLSSLSAYWPWIILALGLLLLAWSERSRIAPLVSHFIPSGLSVPPAPEAAALLLPAERFDCLYRLRTWCAHHGADAAVKAIDDAVLPAIVREEG